MGPWKRICCPVDFTEASRAALEAAADLARRQDAELIVLHVAPARPAESPFAPPPHERRPEAGSVTAWAEEASRAGARAISALASGRPADEIVAFARERGADLLVLGPHELSGAGRFLHRSVTEEVVRRTPCPVLVMPPG